jgi:uncharacterized membrane protein YkoI
MSDKIKRGLLALVAVAGLAAGGAAIAGATSGSGGSDQTATSSSDESAADQQSGRDEETGARDDGEGTPVTGSEFERASAVALDAAGGGHVSGSEKNDEEGYYEIEVTRDDGTQVDVHLDRNLNVIDASADD